MNLHAKPFVPNMNPHAKPFVPTHRLMSIAALNARSLQNKEKREDVIQSLMKHHDIAVISESWLPFRIDQEFPALNIQQGSLGNHRQVLITAKKELKLQPIFPDLWTECLAVNRVEPARISAKGPLPHFFLIAIYWPPGQWKEQLPTLQAIVHYCRNRNPDLAVIVAGDFNLSPAKMKTVANKINLQLAQQEEELPTHLNSSTGRYNQLDYILTSANYEATNCPKENQWSDHNVLSSRIILASSSHDGEKRKPNFQYIIKRNLSIEEEKKILNHPAWPRRSFLQVAKILGLTQKIRNTGREDGGTKYIQNKQAEQIKTAMRDTERLLHEYEHSDEVSNPRQQEEVLHQIKTIWQKGTARLYLKCLENPSSPVQKRLLEETRCRLPKHFFQAIKQVLKVHNKAIMAKAFRTQISGGYIKPPKRISEYLGDLFRANDNYLMEPCKNPSATLQTSKDEVQQAIKATNKRATGIDGLPTEILKRPAHLELISDKLANSINSWLKQHRLPSYLKRGKLLVLSKEDTAYPSYGAIRSISMGTGLTKILETIILDKLKEEVKVLQLIHPQQRGFQEGKNTLQNIQQLVSLIQEEQRTQLEYRERKIPVARRNKKYIFFIDLKRAFDSVDKNKLLNKLRTQGISETTINAIRVVIDGNSLQMDEEVINTNIGVPQGSKLSPLLFVLYINDLIEALNKEGNRGIAFADDIVVISQNQHALSKAVIALEQWSKTTGIEPNTKKSAIMEIRKDERTPAPCFSTFMGYPITKEYKYLGVSISDSLQLTVHNQKLKSIAKAFQLAISQRQASRLPAVAKYQAWSALYLSKASYASWYLSTVSAKATAQMLRFHYQSIKTLFQINQRPQQSALFLATTGMEAPQFTQHQQERAAALLKGQKILSKVNPMKTLKTMVKINAGSLIKYLTRCAFPKARKAVQLRQCHCGQILNQQHTLECPQLVKYWAKAAASNQLHSARNLKLQIQKHPKLILQARKVLPLLGNAARELHSQLNKQLPHPPANLVASAFPPKARTIKHRGDRTKPQRPPGPIAPQKRKPKQTVLYDYFRPTGPQTY